MSADIHCIVSPKRHADTSFEEKEAVFGDVLCSFHPALPSSTRSIRGVEWSGAEIKDLSLEVLPHKLRDIVSV